MYRAPDWSEDVVQLADEASPPDYVRLLRPVMRQGRIIPGSLPPLGEVWELAQANLHAIPEQYRALKVAQPYPVRISEALQRLRDEAMEEAQAAVTMPAPDEYSVHLAAAEPDERDGRGRQAPGAAVE